MYKFLRFLLKIQPELSNKMPLIGAMIAKSRSNASSKMMEKSNVSPYFKESKIYVNMKYKSVKIYNFS
jgi:hypothetical protein